jgi:dihydrofolate reductase
MRLILLAAVAHDRAIGVNNALPWHLPEDLRRFKELTIGHTVLMGRKTFDSIVARLGKPLPQRRNLVLTRSKESIAPSAEAALEVLHSLEALHDRSDSEIYVIGGAQIYERTMADADELDITEVDMTVTGADAFFPVIDPAVWHKEAADWQVSQTGLRYRFVRYLRRTDPSRAPSSPGSNQ